MTTWDALTRLLSGFALSSTPRFRHPADFEYYLVVKYRQLLRMLQDDGWRHERTTGSHMMYVHPTKPGPVVVPAGGKEGQDVPRGTLNSILRQAGLK